VFLGFFAFLLVCFCLFVLIYCFYYCPSLPCYFLLLPCSCALSPYLLTLLSPHFFVYRHYLAITCCLVTCHTLQLLVTTLKLVLLSPCYCHHNLTVVHCRSPYTCYCHHLVFVILALLLLSSPRSCSSKYQHQSYLPMFYCCSLLHSSCSFEYQHHFCLSPYCCLLLFSYSSHLPFIVVMVLSSYLQCVGCWLLAISRLCIMEVVTMATFTL
jgi:hypothetical protein